MKRKVKIATDVVMYFIILYLMSYRAGRGLFLHGILGCFLFVLFMLHHILNGRWYSGLKKGRYRPDRIFFVGIDFLLFAAMVGMAASFARTLHMLHPSQPAAYYLQHSAWNSGAYRSYSVLLFVRYAGGAST